MIAQPISSGAVFFLVPETFTDHWQPGARGIGKEKEN